MLKVCPFTLDVMVESHVNSRHIGHLLPLHLVMIENPLCVLRSVELFNKEAFEMGLLGLNFNGDRITLGEEKSLVLLNVDDGKFTVLTEGNLKGVSLIRGDLKNAMIK